ncbi:MFS transporter [Enterococcus faecalis]|nr:MFS transporter [Enterococcus faecalis]
MYKNKIVVSILLNRFVSLIIDYGYLIILSILFSRHSISMIMFLWIGKAIGDFLAFLVDRTKFISRRQPRTILIGCEIIKGLLLGLIYIVELNPIVFIVIIIIELINTIFSSNLTSIVPSIIDREQINKFNSLYTAIGSASYFLAPLVVGTFVLVKDSSKVFLIYSFITIVSSVLLFFLPNQIEIADTESPIISIKGFKDDFVNVFNEKKMLKILIFVVILSQIVCIVFDSYEVVYLTKELKLTESEYAFSLSFLACIYLGASTLYYKIGNVKNNVTHFKKSSIIFVLYLLFFSLGKNIVSVLISFTFLAISQTIMGICLANYIQTSLERVEIKQIYIYQDMIQSVVSSLLIMIIGIVQVEYTAFRYIYITITIIYIMAILILYGFKQTEIKEE